MKNLFAKSFFIVFMTFLVSTARSGGVLKEWRTLDLPIMPPDPVSFHAFPHIRLGLHSPAKHVFVYDYRKP